MITQNDGSRHWADMEEAGAFWGLKFLAVTYRIAGRRACLIVMFPALVVFYLFLKTPRQSIQEFRSRVSAIEGADKSGFWSGFRNFLAFGGAALDKISAWNGDIKLSQLILPDNMDELFDLDPDNSGAVLFVSHLGNVEVIRALASLNEERQITVLVHTKNAQRFNKLMTRFNAKSQLRLIEVTEIGPEVAAHLKDVIDRGEWVVIAADRPPVNGRGNIVWAPFLGHSAPFAIGPYILAHILEKPVFLIASLKVGDRFVIEYEKLSDRISLPRKTRKQDIGKWAEQYAQWLEGLAIKYPDQWFNFFQFWAPPKD